MKKNKGFAYFVAIGLCAIAPASGHAESGTVDIVLSAKPNVYAIQMGDTMVTASGGAQSRDAPETFKVRH